MTPLQVASGQLHVCVCSYWSRNANPPRGTNNAIVVVVVVVQLEPKTQPCAAFTCQFVFGQRLNNELIFATFASLSVCVCVCVAHAAHVMLHYVGLPQSESLYPLCALAVTLLQEDF